MGAPRHTSNARRRSAVPQSAIRATSGGRARSCFAGHFRLMAIASILQIGSALLLRRVSLGQNLGQNRRSRGRERRLEGQL